MSQVKFLEGFMPPIVVVTLLIVITTLITIGLSNLLYKVKPIAIFILPIITLGLAVYLVFLARATDDLSGVAMILFALVFMLVFVISGIYSLIKYAKIGKES